MRIGWKLVIKAILIVGVVLFLFKSLFENWSKIADYPWEIHFLPLGVSFACLAAFYLLSFLIWHLLCRGMGLNLNWFNNFGIWFFSQSGKYLPGKIWGAVGRIYMAEQHGVRRTESGVCLTYEAAFTVFGGSAVAVLTLPFWTSAPHVVSMGWWIAGLAGMLFLMNPRVLGGILNRVLRILRVEEVPIPLSAGVLFQLFLLSLLLWVTVGTGFYFLVESVYPIHGRMFFPLMGIFAAGCVLSFIAFLTPAGIGVREGLLIFLLKSYLPEEVAVIVALGARLWITVVEIIGIGIGGWVAARSRKLT